MSKDYEQLLQQSKYALLDLKWALEQYDVSGDHEIPAWQTVKELNEIVCKLDPNFESVVDWEPMTCELCGNEARLDESPEGQLCGVCDQWICKDCQDCKAGLGNEPHKEQDVVCKLCSGKKV